MFVIKCNRCGSYYVKKHSNKSDGLRFECNLCGHTFSLTEKLPGHEEQAKRIPFPIKVRIIADTILGTPRDEILKKYNISRRTLTRVKISFSKSRVVFVWRINYEDADYLRKEIEERGVLWQGWGWEDLRRGEKAYLEAALRSDPSLNRRYVLRRFEILKPLLTVKEGDYVLVPKYAGEHTFMLAQVIGKYDFQPDHPYGHYVRVRGVRVFRMAFESVEDARDGYDHNVQRLGEFLRTNRTFHYAVAVIGPEYGSAHRIITGLMEGD